MQERRGDLSRSRQTSLSGCNFHHHLQILACACSCTGQIRRRAAGADPTASRAAPSQRSAHSAVPALRGDACNGVQVSCCLQALKTELMSIFYTQSGALLLLRIPTVWGPQRQARKPHLTDLHTSHCRMLWPVVPTESPSAAHQPGPTPAPLCPPQQPPTSAGDYPWGARSSCTPTCCASPPMPPPTRCFTGWAMCLTAPPGSC